MTADLEKEWGFTPRPAVESRFDFKRGTGSFVPEVRFENAQYVLGPARPDRETAQRTADEFVDKMKQAMLEAARPFVANLKKAKE